MEDLAQRLRSLTLEVKKCGWCHSNAINLMILDCDHLSMCDHCLKEHPRCPTCETVIKRALKISLIDIPYTEQLRKETLNLWIKFRCVLCRKKRKNILLLDCYHLATCNDCL